MDEVVDTKERVVAKLVIGALAWWMALAVGFVAVLADTSTTTPRELAPTVGVSPSSGVGSTGRGSTDMVERHVRMTNQMRVSVADAGMRARMAGDPMWQMRFNPAYIRAEEDYQRQMDRMLGRAP